jgi:outer membrane protein assembly factor BamB
MTTTLPRGVHTAIAVCLATALGSAAAAPGWRQPAYDAGQTYYNPNENTLKPGNVDRLVLMTSLQPGYNATTAPTRSGDALFLCSDKYELAALDAGSGALRWASTAPDGSCSGAVLGDTALYTTAWHLDGSRFVNTLASIDPSDGSARWQVLGPADPPDGRSSWLTFNLPTLSKGTLHVSHGRSLVSAYTASDGHLRWRVKTGSLNNQVTVADGLVLVTTWAEGRQPNRIYAYHATKGTRAWSQPVNGSQYPATAADGRVFVTSNYGEYAFDSASGAPVWQITYTSFLSAPPALTPQSLIVNSGHSTIQALDPATGATQWTTTLTGTDGVESNLVVAGNVLYAATTDFGGTMRLAAFDVRTGQQLLRSSDTVTASYAQVHVMDGKVYLAFDGTLAVFGLAQ